jgi:hypothetical protein
MKPKFPQETVTIRPFFWFVELELWNWKSDFFFFYSGGPGPGRAPSGGGREALPARPGRQRTETKKDTSIFVLRIRINSTWEAEL